MRALRKDTMSDTNHDEDIIDPELIRLMNDHENTYRAYAVPWSQTGSSINYEITIADAEGSIIGCTQAETANDVELMARDWLDIMGRNGDAPLKIIWPHNRFEDGHRTNGTTRA